MKQSIIVEFDIDKLIITINIVYTTLVIRMKDIS